VAKFLTCQCAQNIDSSSKLHVRLNAPKSTVHRRNQNGGAVERFLNPPALTQPSLVDQRRIVVSPHLAVQPDGAVGLPDDDRLPLAGGIELQDSQQLVLVVHGLPRGIQLTREDGGGGAAKEEGPKNFGGHHQGGFVGGSCLQSTSIGALSVTPPPPFFCIHPH